MDFIKLVSSKQVSLNYSDKYIADKSGISEYLYYNLKKYRIYLSKVSYYSLCCVFGLPILPDCEISLLLDENKTLVGLPESNLQIAAECVNPSYVEKMESELLKLRSTFDTIALKNAVINKQYSEISSLTSTITSLEQEVRKREQSSYSLGLKDGVTKLSLMRECSNQSFLDSLNSEYTDKINRLEGALSLSNDRYLSLYRYVYNYSKSVVGLDLDLSSFVKPAIITKEEVGLVLSPDKISFIMSTYLSGTNSIESLSVSLKLPRSVIEDIVLNYVEVCKEGVISYVKRA